jgi:hypothetical protein
VLHAQRYLAPELVGLAVKDEDAAAVAVEYGLDLLGYQLKEFVKVGLLGHDTAEIHKQAQTVFQFFGPVHKEYFSINMVQ